MAHDNPYAAPSAEVGPPFVDSDDRREALRNVAKAMRLVNIGAACHFLSFGVIFLAVEYNLSGLFALSYFAALVLGLLGSVTLANRLAGPLLGIPAGLVALIPAVGGAMMMLLTTIAGFKIRRQGYVRVGFFWPDLKQFDSSTHDKNATA